MSYLFSLAGKKAIVTGGAQGLGRMIAEGLLRAGATVAITSRKADICEAAASEMGALGTCIPLPADLSTPEAAVDLVARYRDAVGACHILVNNAGKTWGGEIDSFPDMMTRDLAGDLAARNITVNAVIPGFFPTKMTAHMRDEDSVDAGLLAHIPLGRLGKPDDIAGIVVFLCSRAGAYVTGAQIPVDGGVVGCG